MKTLSQNTVAPKSGARLRLALLAVAFLTWQIFAAAPCDFDGDGVTDFAVVRNTGGGSTGAVTWFISYAGTGAPPDPTRPALQGVLATNGQFRFAFNTQAGTNYTIQFKSSFTQTNWQALTNLTGTGGFVTNTSTVGTNKVRFFRVSVP